MSDKFRILLSAILLAAAVAICKIYEPGIWWQLAIYAVPYLIAGSETLAEAWESLIHGRPLDEDFLMSVATLGAFAIAFLPGAEPQFTEAVMVMLLFRIGELFESLAESGSRRSISHLLEIRPDSACVLREGGQLQVDPEQVNPGELILIRPGDRVPLDCEVTEGSSSFDTSALTGESRPVSAGPGDLLYSGSINIGGVLTARVLRSASDSTVSRILRLVEESSENKSRSENFITRFARIYTPVVVGLALFLALVPGLISGNMHLWLYRALTFLIVSCPCALVISIPLAFFGGIGGASRRGILIKGSRFVEALADVRTVVFDKTGTLTKGVFEVTAIHPETLDETALLHLAAHVERYSSHPVAISLRQAYPDESDDCSVQDVHEIPGRGVTALVNGQRVAAGNSKLMDDEGALWRPCSKTGSIVHVSIDGQYAGHIVISDVIKEESASAVGHLHSDGMRVVMLTGDDESAAAGVAASLGIADYHAALLPEGKLDRLEELIAAGGGGVCFVGDGINDAPVLSRADVGIAMGGLGSDAAIEASDVVLMDDDPRKVFQAVRLSRRTVGIARQNTVFAISVKMAILVLAAIGLAPMWLAVFGDVGVTILAVLNSSRALSGGQSNPAGRKSSRWLPSRCRGCGCQ